MIVSRDRAFDDLGDKFVMMIEPKGLASTPVEDEITELARTVLALARPETNSLLVHYIAEHRMEVPPLEIKKLRKVFGDVQ